MSETQTALKIGPDGELSSGPMPWPTVDKVMEQAEVIRPRIHAMLEEGTAKRAAYDARAAQMEAIARERGLL